MSVVYPCTTGVQRLASGVCQRKHRKFLGRDERLMGEVKDVAQELVVHRDAVLKVSCLKDGVRELLAKLALEH